MPTSTDGSPLASPSAPTKDPLPGLQPQSGARPALPGANVDNPPPIVADPQPPPTRSPLPAGFNEFAAIAAAVFEALAVGGPEAAQSLLDWAQNEKNKP